MSLRLDDKMNQAFARKMKFEFIEV